MRHRMQSLKHKWYNCFFDSFFLSLFLLCLLFFSCKIVKLDTTQNKDKDKISIFFDTGFDAAKLVDTDWDAKILPYFLEKAVDINKLLEQAATDPKATTQQYAHTETLENTNYNFAIKGTGKIIKVNTESQNGTIEVDLGSDKLVKRIVTIQIGPVIKNTSIRDALDIFSYTDFRNQLEFASFSNEINRKVRETVAQSLTIDKLLENTISFYGAFSLRKQEDYSSVIITPVKINLVK